MLHRRGGVRLALYSLLGASNNRCRTRSAVVVDDTNIIDVWADNMEAAFKEISEIVQTVPPPRRARPPPPPHTPNSKSSFVGGGATHTTSLTPYTLHPTPYTQHPAPNTLHPTPYTPHPRGALVLVSDEARGVNGL